MAPDEGNGKVGYRKPPVKSRFKKGQSGNPGGRPRGNQSLLAEIEEALNQKVTGFVDGKRQQKSVRGIIARNLAKKAAEGNLGAVALIDKIETRKAPASGETGRAHTLHDLYDPENPPRFEVTLELEEAPIRRPDFVEGVSLFLLLDELDPDIRFAIEEMDRWKEFLIENKHRLPRSIDDLLD